MAVYGRLIISLSKKLLNHQRDRNNIYKCDRLIVIVSLFCQVSFEETIQCFTLFSVLHCSMLNRIRLLKVKPFCLLHAEFDYWWLHIF